jgi:hypothetical protein
VKTIVYGSVTLLTDDEVADALMEYALALSRLGLVESVTIPAWFLDRPSRPTILLGPAIPLIVVDAGVVRDPVLEGGAEAAVLLRLQAEAFLGDADPQLDSGETGWLDGR